jgi:4-carboxymuconolactone decarboxylase
MSFVGDRQLYELGAQLRAEVQGPERVNQALRDEDDLDEFYHLFGHECCYARVWSRNSLSRKERALATFAMIATLGPASGTLRVHTRGAIRSGCGRAQIRQVLAMVTWYAGVPVGQLATETVRRALKEVPEQEARRPAPLGAGPGTVDLASRGREIRARVLGPSTRASASGAVQAHEDMLDSHYFGVLWANEDLSLRERCLVVLGVMCGARSLDDAEQWFGAALRLGYTVEQMEDFALNSAAYCGELSYARLIQALASAVKARGD